MRKFSKEFANDVLNNEDTHRMVVMEMCRAAYGSCDCMNKPTGSCDGLSWRAEQLIDNLRYRLGLTGANLPDVERNIF